MRRWFTILGRAARSWSSDNAFQHCAAVSLYTLFSLAPITLIATGIAGLVLGKDAANRQFSAQLTQLVGKDSARMVQETATAALGKQANWISAAVGIAVLLVGATTVFAQLQQSLNEIWEVRSDPRRNGIILMVLHRLISFAMVLTVGFLLLVSLIVTTALTAFLHSFGGMGTVPSWVVQGADFSVALIVVAVLFALFFKMLPDVQLRWRDVVGGALFTAVLFGVGRFLIALYLGHSTVASVYGAAGSLVALLVWVYYSCAILFFGAELTRATRLDRGPPLRPKKNAVMVRQQVVSGKAAR